MPTRTRIIPASIFLLGLAFLSYPVFKLNTPNVRLITFLGALAVAAADIIEAIARRRMHQSQSRSERRLVVSLLVLTFLLGLSTAYMMNPELEKRLLRIAEVCFFASLGVGTIAPRVSPNS